MFHSAATSGASNAILRRPTPKVLSSKHSREMCRFSIFLCITQDVAYFYSLTAEESYRWEADVHMLGRHLSPGSGALYPRGFAEGRQVRQAILWRTGGLVLVVESDTCLSKRCQAIRNLIYVV